MRDQREQGQSKRQSAGAQDLFLVIFASLFLPCAYIRENISATLLRLPKFATLAENADNARTYNGDFVAFC